MKQRRGLDEPVLKNQVRDKMGKPVTDAATPGFIKTEILPLITPDPQPYQSMDGRKRRRYSVDIKMVPEHLDIRARRYLPLVTKNAKRFGLDPRLVMAVIHTESYFNPMAISGSGAIGLMQMIPRHGGRDACRYLYGEDRLLRPVYFHAPGVNVELGSAYLHLLQKTLFFQTSGIRRRTVTSLSAPTTGDPRPCGKRF